MTAHLGVDAQCASLKWTRTAASANFVSAYQLVTAWHCLAKNESEPGDLTVCSEWISDNPNLNAMDLDTAQKSNSAELRHIQMQSHLDDIDLTPGETGRG